MFWYMATPYSKYPSGIEAAFVDAAKAAAVLLKRGELVYSPIAHTHPIAIHGDVDPLAHSIWIPFDTAIMERCDGITVIKMPSWKDSYGVNHEVKEFKKAGKPVRYLSWPELTEASDD